MTNSRHHFRLLVAVCLSLLLVTTAVAQKQKDKPTVRNVHGLVLNAVDHPIENAVVYLKNTRTKDIRSVITSADGKYEFRGLQFEVDYEIYADISGHHSPTRVASAYDDHADLQLDLKVPIE